MSICWSRRQMVVTSPAVVEALFYANSVGFGRAVLRTRRPQNFATRVNTGMLIRYRESAVVPSSVVFMVGAVVHRVREFLSYHF